MRPSAIRNSSIHPTSKINSGCQVVQSDFGKHSYCGYDCVFVNVEVGSFCSISDNVIIGGSGHPLQFVSTSSAFLARHGGSDTKLAHIEFCDLPRTEIGSDVWIGKGTHIRSGVSIGHGAVVGMGSVVTRSCPPYTIIGGNPARIIRPRFSEKIINQLLELKWWEWPDDEIKKYAHKFNDPETFLKALEKR